MMYYDIHSGKITDQNINPLHLEYISNLIHLVVIEEVKQMPNASMRMYNPNRLIIYFLPPRGETISIVFAPNYIEIHNENTVINTMKYEQFTTVRKILDEISL